MLPIFQKIQKSADQALPIRLPTGPRARALVCPRAGPWITVEGLTAQRQSGKVTHVLHHEHWTDMV